MVSKLYDGSNWKNLNGLKLWNGSDWKNSVRGWLWDGSNWKQWYPEYPINTAAPAVSGTATQGNTLSSTTGSWNSNLAYSPSSYSYQWRRGSSDISGATSSTYATVLADVGNAISCRVTATNNRGTTPVVSSNSITVTSALPGAPSNLSITSTTTQPGAFSVSTSSSAATTASGSWTSATNTTSYSASTSAGSISADTGARTFTISSGTSGSSYTVTVTAFNTSGSASLSWSAGSNATSYDIYINGVYWTNTESTSISYSWGTTGTLSVNVRSRNAAGAETTGVSNSATISANSRQAQASSTFYAVIPTISGVTNSGKTDNSVTISWSSTNQSSYSITGLGGSWTGTTATSRAVTGLSGSTSYTATVTVTSSTGQTASGSTNFTTNVTPVIPTFTSAATVTGISSTGGTLSWGSTNQSSYSISTSPSTALNGATGFTATSRLFTGLTAGTTYNYTVTITSSTGNTAQSSGSFTTTGGATIPGEPSGLNNVYNGGTSYTFSWTAVSGATSYQIIPVHALSSTGSSASEKASRDFTSGSTYDSSADGGTSSTYVSFKVRATNSAGSSAYSPIYTPYR